MIKALADRRLERASKSLATALAQLEDNLACVSLQLSDAQLQTLNQASAIELGHPYNFTDRELVRSLVYGGMYERLHNHRPLR